MNTLRRQLLRASLGLAGPIEPTERAWREWVEVATRERVAPLLHSIVEASPNASPRFIRAAEAVQLDVMGLMVRLEHELLEIAAAMDREGYEYAVLKGVATAHLDYSRPELRQSGDVDLLVSPDNHVAAIQFLAALGWKQAYSLPRHHEAFAHATTLRKRRGAEIDLHQRIAHRAVGWQVPTDELLANRCTYGVAGRTLWALSDVDRVIHAAVHDVMSRPPYHNLSSTADVLVLTMRHTSLAEHVIDRADRWGVRRLVASAVERAYQEADVPIPEPWRAALAGSPPRRRLLVDRAYLSDRRRPLLEELAYFKVLGGWRLRTRYITGYFKTDPDYARHRRRSGLFAQSRYLWSRLRSR